MKKNIKNQKGAISLFVLLSMMFFMAFMLGAFTLVNRRNATQVEALAETQKIYSNKQAASEKYDSIFVQSTSSVVPITNIEQLKKVKEVAEGTDTYKYLINGKIYTYEKNAEYVLQNDIILDFDDTFNGKRGDGTGTAKLEYYDYVLYNSTYNINLNGHSIYYQKKSDGSLWKLVCYHNAKNSSTMFSSDATASNYWGKSYLVDRFSLLENGISPYAHSWGTNQNYEFLLMYSTTTKSGSTYNPGNFDTSKNYNRWRQKNNPKDEPKKTSDGSLKVDGYDVSFTGASTSLGTTNFWGGLARGTSSRTFLDGSIGFDNWYYAVGSIYFYDSFGIPVSDTYKTTYGKESAREQLLFVRYK